MRKVKQDAMAIHTRHAEKTNTTLLSHDQLNRHSDTHDEREQQESTVVSLGINKDSSNHNHNHMDSSSTDSTPTSTSPPQLPLEQAAASSSSSVSSSPHPFIEQLQQQPLSSVETQIDSVDSGPCPSAASSSLAVPTDQLKPLNSVGLDLWHTWLARPSGNAITPNSQISPGLLLRYLNAVVIPIERSSNSSDKDVNPSLSANSMIQTYIEPILQLWQQQEQQQQQPRSPNCEQLQTSSITSYSAVKSVDHGTTTVQQQDHSQRLIQLERSYKNTAQEISQLKDQVQQLIRHKELNNRDPTQDKNFSQTELPQLRSRNTTQSTVDELSSVLAPYPENGEQDQNENQSSTLPQQQDAAMTSPLHQAHRISFYHNDRSREDELIAVIAKGLERYHTRSLHGHIPHYPAREPSMWCHDEEYARERRHQLPHRPISASPGATAHHAHHGREPLDSLDPEQQSHPDMTAYEGYSDQRHAGFQRDDLLIPGRHERPTRTRKRSSSTNGPGPLVRENIKQARSCSPLRPRTNSGETAIEGAVPTSPGYGGNAGEVGGHVHAQSLPPSSRLASQTSSSFSSRSTSGAVINSQALCKDLSSTATSYNGTADYYETQPQHNYAHHPRSSRGHKYSHTSQLSRSGTYTDEEYASYHHQYQGYEHSDEPATAVSYGDPGTDQNYSSYFHPANNAPYRGRHSKNQASLSSQYSTTQQQQPQQHQYQRNDSRVYHGYDQQPNYLDHQEEDVKPQHYQQKNNRQDTSNPIYVMNRQVNTVPELWKEWTVGLGSGNPSIRQLEAQYGPSWRTTSSAANFFSRRLRIINEIQRMIDFEGMSEEEAVNRLEARREQGVVVPGTEGVVGSDGQPAQTGGMSLHRLSEILRKKQM